MGWVNSKASSFNRRMRVLLKNLQLYNTGDKDGTIGAVKRPRRIEYTPNAHNQSPYTDTFSPGSDRDGIYLLSA